MKEPVMSGHCKPYQEKISGICRCVLYGGNAGKSLVRWISISMLISALLFVFIGEAKAERTIFDREKRIIVVDPGHGGHDKGSRGSSGINESTVTLNLARMIQAELENRYKVILTRTDDYWIDVTGRTNMANHLKADLFISLHVGGSFLHQVGGMTLFYFKPAGTEKTEKPIQNETAPSQWENIQKQYSESGKFLALLVKNCLLEQGKNLESEIQGAPVKVLEGADMPAILIELGYLTNPAEEKALCEGDVRWILAKGIARGIDDFFKKALSDSYINLHE